MRPQLIARNLNSFKTSPSSFVKKLALENLTYKCFEDAAYPNELKQKIDKDTEIKKLLLNKLLTGDPEEKQYVLVILYKTELLAEHQFSKEEIDATFKLLHTHIEKITFPRRNAANGLQVNFHLPSVHVFALCVLISIPDDNADLKAVLREAKVTLAQMLYSKDAGIHAECLSLLGNMAHTTPENRDWIENMLTTKFINSIFDRQDPIDSEIHKRLKEECLRVLSHFPEKIKPLLFNKAESEKGSREDLNLYWLLQSISSDDDFKRVKQLFASMPEQDQSHISAKLFDQKDNCVICLDPTDPEPKKLVVLVEVHHNKRLEIMHEECHNGSFLTSQTAEIMSPVANTRIFGRVTVNHAGNIVLIDSQTLEEQRARARAEAGARAVVEAGAEAGAVVEAGGQREGDCLVSPKTAAVVAAFAAVVATAANYMNP